MTVQRIGTVALVAGLLAMFTAVPAAAQSGWLKDVVKDAVKDEVRWETRRQVRRAVRGAIRCAVGESECERKARERGKKVVYVDSRGEIITDANGAPVMDRNSLPPQYNLYGALAADGRVAVHDVLFDVDQATIKPESAEVLNRIGTMLTEHPKMSLMIEGHTDSSGDFDHNMDLSQRRAEAVKQRLVDNHGIADTRLRSMGLGSTQPTEFTDTEGRKRQDRVELVKIGG